MRKKWKISRTGIVFIVGAVGVWLLDPNALPEYVTSSLYLLGFLYLSDVFFE